MTTKKKKLKPQHQIVVEEVAKGEKQSKAYQKAYPNVKPATARANASRLLAKANISDAVARRVNRAFANNDVTPEEVIGSAVFQMRSSIDDVLNARGEFDLKKARSTGAIDLVKKMEITEKPVSGTDRTERTYKIEMLSNEAGRKEVANYKKVENFAPAAPQGADYYISIIRKVSNRNGTPVEATMRVAIENGRIPAELASDVEKLLLDIKE